MNSKEVLVELVQRLDKPQAEVQQGWREAVSALRRGFSKGRGVTFMGFGTFKVREVKKRRAFHPQKKHFFSLPPKMRLIFRAGVKLRESTNGRR